MLSKISERKMHRVRWLLAIGWLLLIFSFFYDPISAQLTDPENTLSPLSIDPATCVKVQGFCLEETPYALGAQLFWGAIVPSAIFILLVFGHEFWRRICPLSFFSQISNALGIQRRIKRVNHKTGRSRVEPIIIKKDSWLGRNHSYLQFGLFYLGLCSRILFVNSDRWTLGTFLIITIASAILVGFLYGGKTWCNYFCPMAPVQKVYGEPRGLLTSTAHQGNRGITQSMCRAVTPTEKEQSACVACQTPCIDIDAERSYWDGVNQPDRQLIYYGYLGLVIGYFCYYYLYAGNWDYYMSGIWTHEHDQLAKLFSPGFYLFGSAIPIPKLAAVPLTLGFFSGGSYFLGRILEKRYKAYLQRKRRSLQQAVVRHRMFTLCTFIVFNFFFVFGGRYFIGLLPIFLQYFFEALIVFVSTLWFYRTWKRSPDRYLRESLANSLRNQLSKFRLDVSRFVEGRSLEDLDPNEIYVLAKILPGFTREKRLQTYKGVLQESLEEGYISSSSSLEVLMKMRLELDISEQDHKNILAELGTENPSLFASLVRQPLFR